MSSFIDLSPATELDEVMQNIRTILATPRGTVPMNRALGVLAIGLDDPIPAVQARMTQDIIDAVAEFEPRAEIVSITFTADESNGQLGPRIVFRLKNGGGTAVV